MSSKKNNYTKQKYPGLNPNYQVPNRRELIDQDYIHLLNDEEKAWLDKFNRETIITYFDEDDSKNLVKGQKAKRKLFKENNDRNNDLYGNLKVTKRLMFENPHESNSEYTEQRKGYKQDINSMGIKETSSINPEEDLMLTRLALKNLSKQKKKTTQST